MACSNIRYGKGVTREVGMVRYYLLSGAWGLTHRCQLVLVSVSKYITTRVSLEHRSYFATETINDFIFIV